MFAVDLKMFGCKAQKNRNSRWTGSRWTSKWANKTQQIYTNKRKKKKKYGKETGKFARLNECNNKITLSQISFLFVVVGYFD